MLFSGALMPKPKLPPRAKPALTVEPPPPWVLADTVIARGYGPDQVAVELGAQVLRPDGDGASVEICPTAHLRLTLRGFAQLRAVLNQIAAEMEAANTAAM
jgi:hypothetical protein